MKGIVLAGGLGTRLHPVTLVSNKHLLPIYDRPMLYYPLQSLAEAGIQDVCIVIGDLSAGEIVKLIGNGRQFGFRSIYYVYQEKSGGIAEALSLTREFAGTDEIIVILGDNIFTDSIRYFVDECGKDFNGYARVLLAKVPDPERFGVAEFESADAKQIIRIHEKPLHPMSSMAVTGLYCYPPNVFEVIKTLKPSGRGELEITDVNNYYASRYLLTHSVLKGEWLDAGTFDSMVEASSYFATLKTKK